MEVNHRTDLSSRFFGYPRVRSVVVLSLPYLSSFPNKFRESYFRAVPAVVLVCYRYVLIRRVIASPEKQGISFLFESQN